MTRGSIAAFWDAAADAFDDEPDHGLRDARTRMAWDELLGAVLPAGARDVLDAGCGTGSLSLLLAARGCRVVGVDVAPEMARRCRGKLCAAGLPAQVTVADAADPPLRAGTLDVVVARHLLWTLADPIGALARWVRLLRPDGRLVLVEGRWAGQPGGYVPAADALPWRGGVPAAVLQAAVRPFARRVAVRRLNDPALWGRRVSDERYLLVADIQSPPR